MDYQEFINAVDNVACVISVQKNADGTYGELCNEASNLLYLKSVNVLPENYVPRVPYYQYIGRDHNFEAMALRCIRENRLIHSYVDAEYYNAWMDIYMMPLQSEEEDRGYCLFTYEMSPKIDSRKLAAISPQVAWQVIRTAMKFRETPDFANAVQAVIDDLRENCKANRCCLLLTDFEQRTCSVLGDSVIEGDDTPKMSTYVNDAFFKIVETWAEAIAGSNCYIIHDEKDMEMIKDGNSPWYYSMKAAGVHNLVLYPLRYNGKTLGYVWATNFDDADTLNIKATLEVSTFILATEIANHLMFQEMKRLSDVDLLTGLLNRNAMNNRILELTSGERVLQKPYGIVFVDLNGLKRVNDLDGHMVGDQILKMAADILRDVFYDCDVYRIGGDEFLIFARELSREELELRIKTLRIRAEKSEQVRFAIGSCYAEAKDDVRNVMRIADERMYEDKEKFYKQCPEGGYVTGK
ncbi:MAG: sensor domain-containing diguanylate cyclase [Acetatifactor sp.]|nr:sensor domain-containing diguanylate cyclase [Acetatifactor sp.]